MAKRELVTTKTTCDVCGMWEIVEGTKKSTITSVRCASRQVESLDEYGRPHKVDFKAMGIELLSLDLCPKCKKRSFSTIIGTTTAMFSNERHYRFLEEDKG